MFRDGVQVEFLSSKRLWGSESVVIFTGVIRAECRTKPKGNEACRMHGESTRIDHG
jgi:hypothetical protein